LLYFQPVDFSTLWDLWRRMSAQAKAPYEAMAARDADRYREEVTALPATSAILS